MALLLGAVLSTGPALADPYDAALVRAVVAKERALDSNEPANWEDALRRFEEAGRIRETKETNYELATAAARLRQDDLAVEAYEAAIELGLDGTALEKARMFLNEHRPKMGRLAIQGRTGTQIWVGRRLRATLPLSRPLVLFRGTQSIRSEFEGRDVSHRVEIEAGVVATLVLSISSAAPRSTSSPLRQRPKAAPLPASPPDPVVPVALREPSDAVAWGGVGAGAGLAVLGGALVLGSTVALNARRDELRQVCAVPDGADDCAYARPGQQQEAQSKVNSIATTKAIRTGGWIGLGVGSALAGVSGLMLMNGGGRDDVHPSTSWTVLMDSGLVFVGANGSLP